MKIYFSFLLSVFITGSLSAQNITNINVTPKDNGKYLSELFNEIEEKHSVDIITDDIDLLDPYPITGIPDKLPLLTFLELFLNPMDLVPVNPQDDIIMIVPNELYTSFGSRNDNYIVLKSEKDSPKGTVSGLIKDSSGQPVTGAQIVIPKLGEGAISNYDGTFQFKVDKGIYVIKGSFIGFDSTNYVIGFSPLGKSNFINIELFQQSVYLQGVTITAQGADNNIQNPVTGVNSMNIETIKELPAFMGEVDVIRSIITFPGVSTAGELSSGFNVRGGDVGQNLILQDDALIYNPTHLFGFFSAFNPDLINSVDLYKGGGPAGFGGRISSVLNVNLRNGDAGKYAVNGGIGLVSSRLTVEGPIARNRSSFIIGGRISYVNWMINTLNNASLQNSKANFGDLTGKLFFTVNDKNYISVTGYTSYDSFRLNSDSTFSWSTENLSIKWDHSFNDRLSAKLTLSNSNYNSSVENAHPIDGFTYQNSINNLRLYYDVQYSIEDKLESSLGIDINKAEIEPGRIDAASAGVNTEPVDINDQHSVEAAVYFQNDLEISPSIAISAGMRLSNFWRRGADEIFKYDYEQLDGRYPSITDTLSYENGQMISYFNGWEPRLSLRYSVTEDFSLKASYYRTYQYLHLISNTVSTTPQDYWIASGPNLLPERADQWSLGLFKNFNNDKIEISVEGFYKKLFNVIDFIEGADITLNESMEGALIQGEGIAYGTEFMVRKNHGRTYGWISYTYSRSLREFDSPFEVKTINEGRFYPSVYDQPHNLSVILNYRLGAYTTLSTNFSYSTGRPITIPISKFTYGHHLSVLRYSDRNEYRIPDYHRLDISLTIKDKPRQNRVINGEWIIGIYNVYGRKNAYSIFFNSKGTAYKMSILGTIFPSVTYSFKI